MQLRGCLLVKRFPMLIRWVVFASPLMSTTSPPRVVYVSSTLHDSCADQIRSHLIIRDDSIISMPILESHNDLLLAWILGGRFGRPMKVAYNLRRPTCFNRLHETNNRNFFTGIPPPDDRHMHCKAINWGECSMGSPQVTIVHNILAYNWPETRCPSRLVAIRILTQYTRRCAAGILNYRNFLQAFFSCCCSCCCPSCRCCGCCCPALAASMLLWQEETERPVLHLCSANDNLQHRSAAVYIQA